MNKPYFETSEGLLNGTYIRAGSLTVKASPEMIESLKWHTRGYSVDEIGVYHASMKDLNEKAFGIFLKSRKISPRKSEAPENLWAHYKLAMKEHQRAYPTMAGILLFGQDPQKYFPEAFVICTRFKGNSGRHATATKDCLGTLPQQIEAAYAFVLNQLNTQFTIKGTKRKEALEIPEEAIREVLINAIAHRSYQLTGPIKIAIYDNRLELFSPGNFPGPLRTNHLESGITYVRNAVICKILREAGFVEKLGSGFITLFESYRKCQLPTPEVIEGPGFIKCILPRATSAKKVKPPINSGEDELFRLFHLSSTINAQDVVKQLSVSRQTASRLLGRLVSEGKLVKVGKGPSTHYKRTSS